MPPSPEMVREKRQFGKSLPKAQDEPEGGEGKDSLESFLEEWEVPHRGDEAGGIDNDNQGNPSREAGHKTDAGHSEGQFPSVFPSRGRPPKTDVLIPPITATSQSSDPHATVKTIRTTVCFDESSLPVVITKIITITTGFPVPDLITETDSDSVSYKTVTADHSGTVTDTATIRLSGDITRLFPQHDKATSNPGAPYDPPEPSKPWLKPLLLGLCLGVGFLAISLACFFGCRARRRRIARRNAENAASADSETPEGNPPEMQSIGTAVTMASISNAQPAPNPPTPTPSPPPPFSSQRELRAPGYIHSPSHQPEIPIIINPFADPTYNSSSGIEDYVVSNAAPLGREPENPFLHPDDRSIGVLQHPRPNSAGDFPPEYTTVDGNPIDASGRRIREERFPFGDEALSLRTESETGSVRYESSREAPAYEYDDPNTVADGFRPHGGPENHLR